MVQGYKGPTIVFLGLLQALCLLALLAVRQRAIGLAAAAAAAPPPPPPATPPLERRDGSAGGAPDDFAPLAASLFGMHGLQLFYCSGHFCEFSGLQYASSFIGFDDMAPLVSGPLLLVNTFGPLMLLCLSLPLAVAAGRLAGGSGGGSADTARGGGGEGQGALAGALLWASGARAAALCVCVASAAVQQGHILLWAIFAPKLVFEMWLCAVADAFLLLGAWVLPAW
ncbi:hypothetical protein MNEG_15376 [Monoraphidium neglectum]|uniref:GPI ethanolamine phosphate transferase 1 n=1 Tax=Monoraphidium neglectum TaxID=145388 RepID=A0A0D2IXB0_9CHLO|nr:hypothetical protein MNEG_15376 [Monoraphidium neglectum]KIY92587.1 hypothetical protein MNEG_15376 [Monoraphidium neglectum]|eukprot:XP_013891607.1 hypothetical protein MNEG_15376 [Monoraphidium neglectum]